MIFVTLIKDNRLVSLSKAEGYTHVQAIDWTPERLEQGVRVKLKELPFRVQLFKVVATNGDIDWLITHHPDPIATPTVQDENAQRAQVEQFQRELKQRTGSENCQCRTARSQPNHRAYCYWAGLSLKVRAHHLGLTQYPVRQRIVDDFLTTALRQPPIAAYLPPSSERPLPRHWHSCRRESDCTF